MRSRFVRIIAHKPVLSVSSVYNIESYYMRTLFIYLYDLPLPHILGYKDNEWVIRE